MENRNRNRNVRPMLSTLESLPLELLEIIFFYSLNDNLPRASPYLAAIFSREHVYRLLILLAFWDNDKRHDVRYNSYGGDDVLGGSPARYEDLGTCTWRENRMFNIYWILRPLGRDYVPLTANERGKLQSSILMCRWCTNEKIRRYLPDLTRLIIARWCINAGYMCGKDSEAFRDLEELVCLEHEGERTEETDCITVRGNKLPHPEQRNEEAKKDYYRCCQILVMENKYVLLVFSESFEKWPGKLWFQVEFPLLGLREIPPSLFRADVNSVSKGLVRGSFTDAHLSLLSTIRLSSYWTYCMPYVSLQTEVAYSRDALLDGIRTAITTINPRALDLLLRYDVLLYYPCRLYYMCPSNIFPIAAQTYLNVSNDRRNNNNNNKDAHIKKAQDDALLCFLLLLTTSEVSLPDEPMIRQLAKTVGDPFETWLLDFMSILPGHDKRVRENFVENVVFMERKANIYRYNEPGLVGRLFYEVMPTSTFFEIPGDLISEETEYHDRI